MRTDSRPSKPESPSLVNPRRRGLLLALGAGGAGAAAVAAGALTSAAPAVPPVASNPEPGYRLTEHVQRYYRSAKI